MVMDHMELLEQVQHKVHREIKELNQVTQALMDLEMEVVTDTILHKLHKTIYLVEVAAVLVLVDNLVVLITQ